MSKICLYDVLESEREDFSSIPENNEVCYITESICSDNIDAEAEIISVFVSSVVNKELLDAMPNLKMIACRSTGFNNIDMAEAADRQITVVNVPTYGERTVAEYTFALLLSLTRKLATSSNQLLLGRENHEETHGTDLSGKVLGVIGAGRIGKNVIKIAHAFGMRVVVYDPFLDDAIAESIDVEKVDLDGMTKKADVLTLHAPLTDANKHMINEALIARLKQGVYIINTARGELIDTSALISALNSGKVAGAGLDVLEDEKLMNIDEEELLLKRGSETRETLEHVVANTVLMRMPSVILTNHNAYNTTEAVKRINTTTVDNIKHYLAGAVQNKVGL